MASEASSSVRLRQTVRALLLFAIPLVAWFQTSDSTLAVALAGSSVLANGLEVYRMRRRCMPFPVLLMLVYAAQLACCLTAAHSQLLVEEKSGTAGQGGLIETMSIVMAAHNEHKYMKRTLDSIIESTPAEILIEIIIVDDGSSPPLAPLTEGYDLVKVLRHEARRGLIKSKTEGGNQAVGDMIMFLDAHVRPVPGWHASLLRHVNVNYKRVVVPLIPILDEDTWVVNNNAVGVKMMFDWSLFFNWFEDGNDLVPCMSGGLFGISRQWWHESGEYDYGMNMWGAENIEQSIRIWLCGGEIYVARDSRVAHVFRKSFPYVVNNTEIYINKVRTVETWFDEYKEFYYAADPLAKRFLPAMGDISDRRALQQKMQCKPFKWYVKKFEDVFTRKNMLTREMFLIRDTATGLCLSSSSMHNRVREEPCNAQDKNLRWSYSNHGRGIQHVESATCLDADAGAPQKVGSKVLLYMCFDSSPMQEWTFRNGYLRFANVCVDKQDADGELLLASCGEFLEGKGHFEVFDKKDVGPSVSS